MPLGEPQFATVSLLLGDAVEGTFRVPITDETTVRRLAKDAMHRLIARSNTARHVIPRDKISVSEVFVKSGTDKVEIFAQDLVNQVVLVKEEVLYMRLRVRETVAAEKGEEFLTTTASTVGATTSNFDKNGRMDSTTVQAVDVHSSTEEPPQEKASKGKKNSVGTEKPVNHTSSSFVSSAAAAEEKCEVRHGKRSKQEGGEETEVKKEDVRTVAGGEKGTGAGRRLGWGPEAHKCFADNYIASPNRLMQKCRAKRKATAKKEKTPVTKLKGKKNCRKRSHHRRWMLSRSRSDDWGGVLRPRNIFLTTMSPLPIGLHGSSDKKNACKKKRRRKRKKRQDKNDRRRKRRRRQQRGNRIRHLLTQPFQALSNRWKNA
ncbi:hypothetical protein MOQ_001937 [Trypanosoma cruzi marinkellei]|uniref:Uncharacterized protein n=1 Tax=Trypanosoma cruzi marinkellei TaxID=85056 RepID=K2NJC2_TRYCR|nr:hypothetical protein MOQ_001937 [Trypanosoma cruzi marinkellei]